MKTIKFLSFLTIIFFASTNSQVYANIPQVQGNFNYNVALTITGESTSCGYVEIKIYKKIYMTPTYWYWSKVAGPGVHFVEGTGTVNVNVPGTNASGEMKIICQYYSSEGNYQCPVRLSGYSENEFLRPSGGNPPVYTQINLIKYPIE